MRNRSSLGAASVTASIERYAMETTAPPDWKPCYASRDNLRFNAGRRPEIQYRDLFVKEVGTGR